MNTLKIEIIANPENQASLVSRLYIDQNDLILMLKNHEKIYAKREGSEQIAGQYEGLNPQTLYNNLNMLEGSHNSTDEKVDILDCECGTWGCWAMMISVTTELETITWSNFEQLHRGITSHNQWNYDEFGPFIFDKKAYKVELEKLISRP
jgi:hypothetical protein